MGSFRCAAIALVLVVLPLQAACGVPALAPPSGVVALVQVENSADSDPHSGLQAADVVYEYLAEGGITRFTVVYFDPGRAGKIEPVRSIRPVALRIRDAYRGVLVFSGGSQPMIDLVNSQHVPSVSEQLQGSQYFHRDSSRFAPHNLYTTGGEIRDALTHTSGAATFTFPASGSLSGKGTKQQKFTFQQTASHTVTYTYSESDHAYVYSSERGPLVDAGNSSQPVKVTNVILLQAPHRDFGFADVNGAPVVDFDLSLGGEGQLFSGGIEYAVKWTAVSAGSPPRLVATDGKTLSLPGGLTWIHIIDPGTSSS